MINLMSDTVTKPTPEMLEAMMTAAVGDDVFGTDPTVNALESMAAEMFGKSAAVFCPSGTMTNQIALKIHTNRLTEVICDRTSHIYLYETGGYAANAGIGIQLLDGVNGKIQPDQIESVIKPNFDWLPESALVVVENTANKGGGSVYTYDELKDIRSTCDRHGLKLHLDGARLFNGLIETGDSTEDVGKLFHTLSICLSKGLGAPVGSLLIGNDADIQKARRHRKVMGGGMRQAGYLAAAGIYALENHIDRLAEDNLHAKLIGEHLKSLPYVHDVQPVQSNIVIFDIEERLTVDGFLDYLKSNGILAVQFGPQAIRFVTHMEISKDMIERVVEVLSDYSD